jgi:hypothetical protein
MSRGRFPLPVGADAVGAPGRGLVLRESHAVAADLDVVGERQERVFAQGQLEDLLRELRRHEETAVLTRGFVAEVARCGGADAADQHAGIDRLTELVGVIDGLHEFAERPEAAPGIGFAVVGDDRAEGTLNADAGFVGDQGGFAVDGGTEAASIRVRRASKAPTSSSVRSRFSEAARSVRPRASLTRAVLRACSSRR